MWNYSKERYAAIAGATYEDGEFYKMPLTAEQIRDKIHKPEFGVPSLEMFSIGARSRTVRLVSRTSTRLWMLANNGRTVHEQTASSVPETAATGYATTFLASAPRYFMTAA